MTKLGEYLEAHPKLLDGVAIGLGAITAALSVTVIAAGFGAITSGLAALGPAFAAASTAIAATPLGAILLGTAALSASAAEMIDVFNRLSDTKPSDIGSSRSPTSAGNPAQEGRARLAGGSGTGYAGAQADIDTFVNLRWTRDQAAGIVANIQAESGGNTGLSANGAYGLAQWRGARIANLKAFAQQNKLDPAAHATQLAFINYELRQGGEQKAGQALRQARTAGSAAAILARLYERPENSDLAGATRAAIANSLIGGRANIATGAAASAPVYNHNLRATHTANSSQTSIGVMNVYTGANTGPGIASSINSAIKKNSGTIPAANAGPM